MAKGKATAAKATKSKAGESKAKAVSAPSPKPSKGKEARKPGAAAAAAEKSKPRAAAPAAAPPPPSTPAGSFGGLKKKNVKRGAPPMLPRRMARRSDAPAPVPGQGPPAPPRLVAPPGSLHAPARVPEGAEGLKQRLSTVMGLLNQLRGLKRTLNRQFFEAGLVLQKLSDRTLFEAKGYGSFEKFIEREVERELSIGRGLAHDLVQIVRVFQREAAEELGLERLRSALRTLWPEPGPQNASS